jgi:pimeloyl-ACP methyl ester carboxylesterase
MTHKEIPMNQVTSKDGTSIAYERIGGGPAVILVGGGLVDRSENAPLAPELAKHFTVYNYDRRGRGESGDTQPYAVEREFEDIEALISVARAAGTHRPVHLYGVSSGGGLALEAAAAGLAIDKVAVYEVPYCVAGDTPQRSREYVDRLGPAHAEGRRGDAVELFFRLVGSSDEDIAGIKSSPYWPGLEAIAHTLAYEAACMANYQPPTARLARIAQPTLVITGEAGLDPHLGGLPVDFFDQAAAAIAASIPHADRRTMQGQAHVADPKAVAPLLERFFTD